MPESIEDAVRRLIEHVGERPSRAGLAETPDRYLKALKEYTIGYTLDPVGLLKEFEDGAENYDEMVFLGGIPVWSLCEHHMLPFFGYAHVGYLPRKKIVGLSKIPRVVEAFARRLQCQERLTRQIADCLEAGLRPNGVGVSLTCRHTCMESRGVKCGNVVTTTTALCGVFKTNANPRQEFLSNVANHKYDRSMV